MRFVGTIAPPPPPAIPCTAHDARSYHLCNLSDPLDGQRLSMLLSHTCGPASVNTHRDIDMATGAAASPAVHCFGVPKCTAKVHTALYCSAVQWSAVEWSTDSAVRKSPLLSRWTLHPHGLHEIDFACSAQSVTFSILTKQRLCPSDSSSGVAWGSNKRCWLAGCSGIASQTQGGWGGGGRVALEVAWAQVA